MNLFFIVFFIYFSESVIVGHHFHSKDDDLNITEEEEKFLKNIKGTHGIINYEGKEYHYSTLHYFEGADKTYLSTIKCDSKSGSGKSRSMRISYLHAYRQLLNRQKE